MAAQAHEQSWSDCPSWCSRQHHPNIREHDGRERLVTASAGYGRRADQVAVWPCWDQEDGLDRGVSLSVRSAGAQDDSLIVDLTVAEALHLSEQLAISAREHGNADSSLDWAGHTP